MHEQNSQTVDIKNSKLYSQPKPGFNNGIFVYISCGKFIFSIFNTFLTIQLFNFRSRLEGENDNGYCLEMRLKSQKE